MFVLVFAAMEVKKLLKTIAISTRFAIAVSFEDESFGMCGNSFLIINIDLISSPVFLMLVQLVLKK